MNFSSKLLQTFEKFHEIEAYNGGSIITGTSSITNNDSGDENRIDEDNDVGPWLLSSMASKTL